MPYSDYAILARTNRQLRFFATELKKRGYPIQLVGQQFDMMQQEEFRVVQALWKCVVNPHDMLHAQYLMITPRQQFSGLQIQRLKTRVLTEELPLIELMGKPFITTYEALDPEAGLLEAYEYTVAGLQLVEQYTQSAEPFRSEKLKKLYPLLLEEWITQNPEYAYVQGFLDQYALSSLQDEYDENKDAITLSTVHAAKGLEWKKVFVVGLQQGVFPNKRGDLAEERRLAYVAFTRPQDELSLSGSHQTTNQWSNYSPSQFLKEINL